MSEENIYLKNGCRFAKFESRFEIYSNINSIFIDRMVSFIGVNRIIFHVFLFIIIIEILTAVSVLKQKTENCNFLNVEYSSMS